MNREIAKECSRLSEEEKITFPEVIAKLSHAGVEAYIANMLVPHKIYYGEQETCEIPLKIKSENHVASKFKADKVVLAIRASQSRQIGYQEFLKQIMEAGVAFYTVFINGRKAIYFGRNGEQHVEHFPSN